MSTATVCHEEFLGELQIDRWRSRVDLAREFYVSPRTAGRYLDDLVIRGWAERKRCETFGGRPRGTYYLLTPAGKAAHDDRELF